MGALVKDARIITEDEETYRNLIGERDKHCRERERLTSEAMDHNEFANIADQRAEALRRQRMLKCFHALREFGLRYTRHWWKDVANKQPYKLVFHFDTERGSIKVYRTFLNGSQELVANMGITHPFGDHRRFVREHMRMALKINCPGHHAVKVRVWVGD